MQFAQATFPLTPLGTEFLTGGQDAESARAFPTLKTTTFRKGHESAQTFAAQEGIFLRKGAPGGFRRVSLGPGAGGCGDQVVGLVLGPGFAFALGGQVS